MSMSAFDENYANYPAPRALHARRNGSIAASMIGASTILILVIASIFARPNGAERANAPEAAQTALQGEASPPAEKFTLRSLSAASAAKAAPLDLTLPEFAKLKKELSTAPRERGGRDDIVTIGEFAGRGVYLRLALLQAEGEKLNSDFFLDMSRLAAQAGIAVLRVAPPSPLSTRFGAFESADIRLTLGPLEAAATPSVEERSCLAFRLVNQKLSVETAGLACGSAAAPIDRRSLSCILDRLDYAPGSSDKALDQFFGGPAVDRSQACVASKTGETAKTASSDVHTKPRNAKRSTSRH
jgi:hypothetical protein